MNHFNISYHKHHRCAGDADCQGSELDCGYGDCSVGCVSKTSCGDSDIIGGDAEALNVVCGMEGQIEPSDSCKTSHIDCGTSTSCSVSCFGKTSCGDATIYGQDSSSLTVICDNEDSCKSADITCPNGALADDCIIECNHEKGCEDLSVNGACICNGGYCPSGLC